MTPLAWLLGFVLPACGAEGAQGLPVPVLMDMTRIERPASPNTGLAGPEGMTPVPDVATTEQSLPAPALYAKVRTVIDHEPRTFLAAEFLAQYQVHYVVRSRLMNFPDLVTVQVNPSGPDHSTLIIWSRSIYGYSDMGVNRARVNAWLAVLQHSNQR